MRTWALDCMMKTKVPRKVINDSFVEFLSPFNHVLTNDKDVTPKWFCKSALKDLKAHKHTFTMSKIN